MNRPGEYYNFTWDTIGRWAKVRPSADALYCVSMDQSAETKLSYAEVFRLAQQSANFLRAQGISKGDRVVIMLPRIHEWWILMLVLDLIGAILAPATLLLTQCDLEFRISSCNPKAVITDEENVSKLGFFDGIKIAVRGAPEGWVDYSKEVEKASDKFTYVPTRSDEAAVIYFTSATNSQPKMVVHSHASCSWAHRATGALWLDLNPGDLHWNISDLGWAKAAWSSLYGPWHMGATIFAMNFKKFQTTKILEAFDKYKINTLCAPPTAMRLMMKEDVASYKFPGLRHCVGAGEPLTQEIVQVWKAATGLDIYEGYGQTETVCQIANVRSQHDKIKVGSMGRVMPGFHIEVLDDQQQPVPNGTEGEICIRCGDERPVGLFKEYWNNPEMTRQAYKNGWYLTSDRAVRDEEGYFWFVGRTDDVIKSSDFRIGPKEVETTLMLHPAVHEAAVVGKPDAVRCQLVKAFVVLHDGVKGDKDLAYDIQKHCRALSASYKLPREIEFVNMLPKTTTGKVRRATLRELEKQRAAICRQNIHAALNNQENIFSLIKQPTGDGH